MLSVVYSDIYSFIHLFINSLQQVATYVLVFAVFDLFDCFVSHVHFVVIHLMTCVFPFTY